MEFEEEGKGNKNSSKIKESMVYEEDFESPEQKENKKIEEEYAEEFET